MHSKLASFHWPCQWHTVAMLCLVSLSATGAIGADEFEAVSGRAMGTSYCLKYHEQGLRIAKDELAALVSDELERIESIFSLYRAESEISRLNTAPGGEWIRVSKDLYVVARYAVELFHKTGGAFDPTLRPLMELWQGDRLNGEWQPPSHESIETARKAVGALQLTFQVAPPAIKKESAQVQLDLNALVEGWAIEHVLKHLKLEGCTSALFELGGEFGSIGCKSESEPWRVGVENPQDLSKIYATIRLNDEAVCTSGVYRQARQYAGKHYSHIIDPRSGYPVEHNCSSVSVVHTDKVLADGWATALMVLGPEKGVELANKCGVVASFACRSAGSISPTFSKLADGKIVPTNEAVQSNGRATSFVLAVIVGCASVILLRYRVTHISPLFKMLFHLKSFNRKAVSEGD